MIHLDHRDSRPIYEQIADAFRRQIDAGVLLPGDKLPSVRELSAALSINPNTIQRAYRELEQSGYLTSVPGKGSFAGAPQTNSHRDLWQTFDETVRALTQLGVSPSELFARIKQAGGADHA